MEAAPPDWEQVLRAERHLQALIPQAVLAHLSAEGAQFARLLAQATLEERP